MRKALPSAMKDRSPIQRPWRVPACWISLPNDLPSPSGSGAKQRAGVFAKCHAPPYSETGAAWIWNIAEEQFPEATQIVDRVHAKQHLHDLGKVLYGPTHPRAALWAERRKEELDSGKFPVLLTAIRRQVSRSEEARRCLHYFQTNRHRMRYPEFHAQGLCTSTGVVEAGCKVAIGTRLKRAGMHWTVHGSNAIIALRCAKLSGRFQDFWERRTEQTAA
jgi:hypothetical protein